MHYRVRGREYVIEKRLPDGDIQVKEVVTNIYSAVPERELVEILFYNEDAELLGDNRNQVILQKRIEQTRVSDITLLKDDDPSRADMERRRAYVLAVMRERPRKLTEETLHPIIKKIGRNLGEIGRDEYKKIHTERKRQVKVMPSVSTIIRWVKLFIRSGEDERVFVPAKKARGNRERKFAGTRYGGINDDLSKEQSVEMKTQAKIRAERVAALLDDAINEVLLNEQRFSVQDVYDKLIVKIDDDNQDRSPDDQLPQPHRSSIYDAVNKLDDYEILEARYGTKFADEKYRAFKRGPRPKRPLERTEADHTKVDLFVIDPVMMLPIGRPILTWMICVYTKLILGFYISFNPYGSLAILECLKHAIRPKTYVKTKYPNIKNEWPPYGVMETLVLDNAPEFWGKHLEDPCHQLGVNVQYGQKGRAWFRASIERSFRTLNDRLLHRQPGTTFSNIFDRADYDPRKNALIVPDVLDEVFHKYIIDVLQVSPHRGIRDIPLLRWETSIKQWPPALPARARELNIILGALEHRTIHSYGVEVDTIIYNSEDLSALRSQAKSHGPFPLKRNISDLSVIHVYDEKHDRYIPVPAVDQEYTKGLTLYQHNVIRRYVRERLKKDVDIVALCRAKWEIQEIVEREWKRIKGTTRMKMARFRNEGVQRRSFSADKYWIDEMLNLPEGQEKLLLMSPDAAAKSRKGISDVGNTQEINGELGIQSNAEDVKGFIELPLSTIEGKSEKPVENESDKGAKQPLVISETPAELEDARVHEDIANSEVSVNCDDLDMTGWAADYNLPA